MIVGTPDPKCINCKPDMPFHWHDAVVRVDVHAPRRQGQVATVTVEGVCLSTHEARMLARQLEAAADISEGINVPILDQKRAELAERIACKHCGHTLSAHNGKYFKQRPCGKCDCVDMVVGA
jgi:hypothetical protein